MIRKWLCQVIAVACFVTATAQAQEYPSAPIRIVVPYAAGGIADVLARLVAVRLEPLWKQSVVVENRAGANGTIAMQFVAQAKPDGHVLMIGNTATQVVNRFLYRNLPFDIERSFQPVGLIASTPMMMVVASSHPANSVADLAALARANPGKYSFASGNAPSRIGGEMFKMMSGTNVLHVPYRGAPQALSDLLGSQVSMIFSDLRTAMPQVMGGKLKALAVTGRKRLPIAPNIPTMVEQGYPDYDLFNWVGAYLPAKTPPEIVTKLNALLHAAVKADPAAHESTGGTVRLTTPEEFAKIQAADTAMWARVTKAAGMEPE